MFRRLAARVASVGVTRSSSSRLAFGAGLLAATTGGVSYYANSDREGFPAFAGFMGTRMALTAKDHYVESHAKDHKADIYVRTADDNSFAVFTGNANEHLAREVAMILNMQLGRASVGRFADGEVHIKVLDNVRWKDTYVIQSLSPPVNESLMELLLLVTTLRRASARSITAIIPYFGYSRHSRTPPALENADDKGKRPVAAADVAKLLTVAGVDRVVFVDVHHAQITGFFGRTPVDDLEVSGIAARYFRLKHLRSPVVVAPDHDAVQRAKRFRDTLIANGHQDASLAIVVDQRRKGSPTDAADYDKDFDLVGDVAGKDCIIRDDIIESAQRVVHAAEKLKRAGANRVYAFTTHPLLTDSAFEAIEDCSSLVEVVCCNTVPLKKMSDKVRELSVGALLAETIRRINQNESVTAMFAETKKAEGTS